jgi:PAS domain S-box-containing protein
MRDQHRPKQDLVTEVAALRKQVADLKESMTERRRVEDALRHAEEQLRLLTDGAPVGLCLVGPDGAPLVTNRPFAGLLGYDSPAELLSVASVLGLFPNREEAAKLWSQLEQGQGRVPGVVFRRKDGSHLSLDTIGSVCRDPRSIVVVVLERQPREGGYGLRAMGYEFLANRS